MLKDFLRTVVVLALVFALFGIVASLPMVRGVEIAGWTLDQLVNAFAYGVASLFTMHFGWQMGKWEEREGVLRYPVLAISAQLVITAAALWFLYRAVYIFVPHEYLRIVDSVLSAVIILLTAGVIWLVFTGFDQFVDITSEISEKSWLSPEDPDESSS